MKEKERERERESEGEAGSSGGTYCSSSTSELNRELVYSLSNGSAMQSMCV